MLAFMIFALINRIIHYRSNICTTIYDFSFNSYTIHIKIKIYHHKQLNEKPNHTINWKYRASHQGLN